MSKLVEYCVACNTVLRLALLVPVLLVMAPQLAATSNAAGSDINAGFPSQDYLSAATRLTIRFRGYPNLSGDYRIGPDQTISVPVLGRFSVRGQSAAGLETALARKASEIGGKPEYVTVEIAGYKTLFVMGSVRQSGAIEWQPNLTVLQAVALAGGYAPEFPTLLATTPGGPSVSPVLLAKSIDTLKRDLARYARLVAERDGHDKISTPGKLVELAGAEEAGRLIDAEGKIMLMSGNTRKQKLEVLVRGITAEKDQVSSLRNQLDRISEQLVTRQKQLAIVGNLRTRGIVADNRLFEQEIKVSDLQEKIANIDAAIARSTASLASLELQKVSIQRGYREGVLEAIAQIEEQMSKTGIDLGSAMETAPLRINTGAQPAEEKSRFEIVRATTGKPVPVSSQTILQPGDVLLVAKR